MSYTPTNWQTGDTITAEKLNKLENGVASGGGGGLFKITATLNNETWSVDKTFNEIVSAYNNGMLIVLYDTNDGYDIPFSGVLYTENETVFYFKDSIVSMLDAASAIIEYKEFAIVDTNEIEVRNEHITFAVQ